MATIMKSKMREGSIGRYFIKSNIVGESKGFAKYDDAIKHYDKVSKLENKNKLKLIEVRGSGKTSKNII